MIIQGHLDGSIEKINPIRINKIVNGYRTLSIIGGEFAITSDTSDIAIKTLLGSCVAMIVYDDRLKLKAMNHFLLPESSFGDSYKYGLYSIESMLNEMYKLGSTKSNLSVKIVGGADVLAGTSQQIGDKNIKFAQKFCNSEGIKIVGENVRGTHGRVVLLVDKFKIFVRVVSAQTDVEIKRDEDKLSKLINKVSRRTKNDEITLF